MLFLFIIKGFRTIVFIFIVISVSADMSSFTELWSTSFIENTGVPCSVSVSHNWVQVLSIPARQQDWTCNLQMIVSLEAEGTNAYNRYVPCWTIQSEFLGFINLMFLLDNYYYYVLFFTCAHIQIIFLSLRHLWSRKTNKLKYFCANILLYFFYDVHLTYCPCTSLSSSGTEMEIYANTIICTCVQLSVSKPTK